MRIGYLSLQRIVPGRRGYRLSTSDHLGRTYGQSVCPSVVVGLWSNTAQQFAGAAAVACCVHVQLASLAFLSVSGCEENQEPTLSPD